MRIHLKRSILVHIILNKEPSLVAGLSQTAFGGNRNPEESGGIRRNPLQIQEFLSRRNSCNKSGESGWKQEFFKTPPKPRSWEEIHPSKKKKREKKKSSGILAGTGFGSPKNEFLKKGIGNLAVKVSWGMGKSTPNWLTFTMSRNSVKQKRMAFMR